MFCVFVNLFVRTPFRRGGELVILFVPFLYPVSSHMDGFRSFPFSSRQSWTHFCGIALRKEIVGRVLGWPARARGRAKNTDRQS